MADSIPAGLFSPTAFVSIRVHVFDHLKATKPKHQFRIRLPRTLIFDDLLDEVARRLSAGNGTDTPDHLIEAKLCDADGNEFLPGDEMSLLRGGGLVNILPQPGPPPTLDSTPVKPAPGSLSAPRAVAGIAKSPAHHPGRTLATPSKPPKREIISQKAMGAVVSRRRGETDGSNPRAPRASSTSSDSDNDIVLDSADDRPAALEISPTSRLKPSLSQRQDDMMVNSTPRKGRASGQAASVSTPTLSDRDIYDPPEDDDDQPPSIKKATPLGKGTSRLHKSPRTDTQTESRALQDITRRDNKRIAPGNQSRPSLSTDTDTENDGKNGERERRKNDYVAKKSREAELRVASRDAADEESPVYKLYRDFKHDESDHVSDFDDIDDYDWEKILLYGTQPSTKTELTTTSNISEQKTKLKGVTKPDISGKRLISRPRRYAKSFVTAKHGESLEDETAGKGGRQLQQHVKEQEEEDEGRGHGFKCKNVDDDAISTAESESGLDLDEVTARNTRLNSGSPKKRLWLLGNRVGVKRKFYETSESSSSEDEEDKEDVVENVMTEADQENEQNEGAAVISKPISQVAKSEDDVLLSNLEPAPQPSATTPSAATRSQGRKARANNRPHSHRGGRRRRRRNKGRETRPAVPNSPELRHRVSRPGYRVKHEDTSPSAARAKSRKCPRYTSAAGTRNTGAERPAAAQQGDAGAAQTGGKQGAQVKSGSKKNKKSRRKFYEE